MTALLLAGVALLDLLMLVRGVWAAQVVLVPLLLVLPGILLLRAIRMQPRTIAGFPLYVPCASLVVLFGSGLAVTLLGPLLGVHQPLRTLPLAVGLNLVCLVLTGVAATAQSPWSVDWRRVPAFWPAAWPLLLPLVAAAGALRLNNDRGNAVALVAAAGTLVVIVLAVARAHRWGALRCAVAVYGAGLAALLAFSLRGDLVYGFDIAAEYGIARATDQAGLWRLDHDGDAYGAMLSTSVLPVELHALSGVPLVAVLQVVYPALFALFPVAVLAIARRLLTLRWAVVAAAFVLVQQNLAQQLSALARQEIALLLFAAVLAAAIDNTMSRLPRWTAIVLFGSGVVVSHYSTAYLLIVTTAVGLLVHWASSWWRGGPRLAGGLLVAFVGVSVSATVWYGPVTHSGDNLARFGDTVAAQGFQALPNRTPGEGWLDAYLRGTTAKPVSAHDYADLAAAEYAQSRSYIRPVANADQPGYALMDSSPEVPASRLPELTAALASAQLVLQQLANVLAAVGAVVLLLRRNTSECARTVAALAVAMLVVLVVIRFSGTASLAYNQERALVQALVVFAVTLAWTGQAVARRGGRAVTGIALAAVGVLGLAGSGVPAAVLGGVTQANLATRGEDVERFAMTAGELAAAEWLGAQVTPDDLVYADRYGQLRLHAVTGIHRGLMLHVTPRTVNRNAWVYASTTNTLDGRARGVVQGTYASFEFPSAFLEDHLNKVYTNGFAEVYQR